MKNKENRHNLILFTILFLTAYIGTTVYRPYIYSNHIFDYHFADIIPSLFCVPVAYSFVCLIYGVFDKSIDKLKLILSCAVGFYLYEFVDFLLGGGDWYDCIAIAIGTIVTFIVRVLHQQINKESK